MGSILLIKTQILPFHKILAHNSLQPCLPGLDLRLKLAQILSEVAFLIILDMFPIRYLSPFFVYQLVHGVLKLICFVTCKIITLH